MLVFVSSCTPVGRSQNERNGAEIVNGTKVDEKSPLAASIVAIYDTKEHYLCTGSLLPNNFVLTAAHCVEGAPSNLVIIFNTDMDYVLGAREPDVQEAMLRHVSAAKAHKDYIYDSEKAPMYNASDIALLKFRGTVPDGYVPATMLKDPTALKRGVTVKMAGYGTRTVKSWDVDPKKFTREQLEAGEENGELMCNEQYTSCMGYSMDDSGELYETTAPIKGLLETEFVLDESKSATCSGDSGGPAYVNVRGQWQLAGVTSRGSALCDKQGVYTDVLAFKTWILDTAKELSDK
jgi:secreted trypsin-like serine protease